MHGKVVLKASTWSTFVRHVSCVWKVLTFALIRFATVDELSLVHKFFQDEIDGFNGDESKITKWKNFWGAVNEESKSYNWPSGKQQFVSPYKPFDNPLGGGKGKLSDVGWNRFQTIVALLPASLRQGWADFVLMDSEINGAKAE